ncbi:TlpA family protein disulfide reductase [Flavobacterium columnare NBRC 100251 = ATCC 23463]|uniref:Thiol:disulfide oxidoreductase TlpA n=2 Tax=Flavobacterium columnare TaxID=996 RepID=G8X6W4_FLACA|nr:TlpA disulfide reductase family protein [Flavobacterium columnare]AEW86325.1 thiol:disulfide oxidoreductase TlpA [Flavobacterium columnare ATCC 49512]AMO20019.1 TlpA family protein disulfide reductase [Flavobacterium columnare]ANO48467.1 thiol:disulfide oxidoreductase TlpA [Flavobacterium columnare]APT23473.1 alkyl hydroperoxide reductase [Flavobacterium columnare]AUX17965.1 alkyl hydroperoxide reductase [Flavobacterium columnare]
MKKIITLILTIILNISCSKAQDTQLNNETLNYSLTDINGQKITLKEIISQNTEKSIVLEFWASWCGDCIKNMPNLKKLQIENPDTKFVFISFDKTPETWKIGIEKHELIGDHLYVGETMKGNFGKSVNLDWIPRYIILDKKGKVVLFRAIEKDTEKINTLLKTL